MARIQISPFFSIGNRCHVLITVLFLFSLYLARDFIISTVFSSSDYFGLFKEGESDKPLQCNQIYPVQAKTEFNTFDMYRELVGFERTPKNHHKIRKKNVSELTEIFVMPFTHVDPGWLKTFGTYSNDTNSILDSMLLFLTNHPKMRFMWCEIVFFERWWSAQNDSSKAIIKRFIANKQLEIASGSWVMTDEATPYFPATVDNIIEGQQFVNDELDVQARVMWSNDPFGYGPSVPYLFRKAGTKWAIINRVHQILKTFLQNNRAIPFQWRQHFDSGGQDDVYTHILPYNHYDILNSCGPDQSVCCQYDFKRMTHYSCPGSLPVPTTSTNVRVRAVQLENEFLKMSNLQETNVLLSVWGDDFRYDILEEWYQQYDNLMPLFDYINTHSNRTRIRFGTLTDYFNALERINKKNNLLPATLSGDFFPYQCAANTYWTGYYTTRPFYKRQERELHSLIRAADLLTSSTLMYMTMKSRKTISKDLTDARRNLSLFQHHDAITGTSKNHVMKDYSQRLFASLKITEDVLRSALNLLLRSDSFEVDNIPAVYTESSRKKHIILDQPKTILIYNSASYRRMELIELLVSESDITVISDSETVRAQIEPYFDSVTGQFTKHFMLVFIASLKPLSFTNYIIQRGYSKSTEMSRILTNVQQRSKTIEQISKNFSVHAVSRSKFLLRTEQLSVALNPRNGLLHAISLTNSDWIEWVKCTQSFDYYEDTTSGAYVMNVQDGSIKRLATIGQERFIVSGSVRQTAYSLSKYIKQRLSINNISDAAGNHLHMQMFIDIRNLSRLELITQFLTNLSQEHTHFFTDSIGLQLIKRAEYNDRPEKNYYPMPTALILQDSSIRLSVLSNVAHGARTLKKTGFEIMLDRRLAMDDGKGLGSSADGIPNDNLPVNMAFTFVLERMAQIDRAQQQRQFAYNTLSAHLALQSLIYQPNIFIMNGILERELLQSVPAFPCDVQLLTVRPLLSNPNLRLMVLHRAGIDCSSLNTPICLATELNDAVKKYLYLIGASTVQKTLLNGVEKIGKEISYMQENFHLEPMDFAAYLLRFD